MKRKLIIASIGIAAAVAGGGYLHNRQANLGIYPDPAKTPGAINQDINQININQTLCNPHWSTKSIRPPSSYTSNLKLQQLKSGYNYKGDLNPADYEEDHLISLELGGHPTDPKNLWPESYNTQPLNAKSKDLVENYLHKLVCNNSLTLLDVQRIIVTDWVKCYYEMKKNEVCF